MTAAASFPHLLAPGRIGPMTLRNRLVMSPMETMFGTPEGLPSARTVAYFAARAAGGVGLVTVGATGVDPRHPETPGGLHLGTDDAVAAHRDLVDAVHEHGARIQPQIVHAGPDGLGPEMFGVDSIGPSVIGSYLTGRPSREATREEIAGVIDQLRAGVVRAVAAGYDGIELHAAHGYMFLGSFLAPQRNRRTDRYRGSSPEGRVRVVLEALSAIRGEIGDAVPITLRISGYERVAGGRPIDDTAALAPLLVEAGVDAFHVSGGVIDRLVTGMVSGADRGEGVNLGAAAAVREAVDVPVIAVGRLHDPALAEQALADGRADFVALGRPLLADPDLPAKLARGEGARVRRCISCENCIDGLELRLAVDCALEARTGRELELPLGPTRRSVRVVVGGGGPAGLETARRAAEAGHEVLLVEAGDELGGGLIAGSRVHPGNRSYLDWLLAEIALLRGSGPGRIEVRVGVRADTAFLTALDPTPGAVVLATGGRSAMPDVPGSAESSVLSLRAVAAGRVEVPGRRVVIVGADLAAVETAEHLAAAGHLVALLDDGPTIAPEVGPKRRTEHMDALDRLGVTVHTGAQVEEITADGVRYVPAGGRARMLAADAVLLTERIAPNDAWVAEVTAALPQTEVLAVGDVTGLGLIRQATEQAARAVAAIGSRQTAAQR